MMRSRDAVMVLSSCVFMLCAFVFLYPQVLYPQVSSASIFTSSDASSSFFVSASSASAAPSVGDEVFVASDEVFVARIEGEITEGTYIYISECMEEAERVGASAVIIELNTPGGVSDAMLKITKRILNAKVPVITYVAPEGAICASAGSLILIAGHVAAMSPGTTVGAAMPRMIGIGGVQEADEKTINFFAGHFSSIASARGRNETQAARFVTDNDVLDEREAFERKIIDVIACNESDLLSKTDGITVRIGSDNLTLHTKHAVLRFYERSLRVHMTELIGNPQMAVILLIIGIYGLIFGFMSPETYVPEMVGAICLILALYGIQMFDENILGILLIVLAVILLIAEFLTPTFGILSIGAAVCLVIGALILPAEPLMLSEGVFEGFLFAVIGIGIVSALFFMFAVLKIISIRRKKPKVGDVVGRTASVIEDINGEKGAVKVRGEIWKAKTHDGSRVPAGEKVEIIGREGLTLIVRKK